MKRLGSLRARKIYKQSLVLFSLSVQVIENLEAILHEA